MASQQGTTDDWALATEVLAPEVANVLFRYYDSSGTENDTWDSTQMGALPTTVKVTLWLHRTPARKSPSATTTAPDANLTVYDMLVELPNAAVQASQSGGQGSQASGGAQTTGGSSAPGGNAQ
jgi:hypothetical protein